HVTLLEARRSEKDFLLRKENKYAVRADEMAAEARDLVVQVSARTGAELIGTQLRALQIELEAYSSAFREAVPSNA
ncbi:MAG: hypothetical protein ACXW25_01800, partial [Rhodospirillales bacterium]